MDIMLVLLLQTLSITLHAQWNPNPPAENVVQYVMTIDGGSDVVIPAVSCAPTVCSQAYSVPSFGAHAVTLKAQNLLISTTPTSLQSGPTVALSYTLGATPSAVGGGKVGP